MSWPLIVALILAGALLLVAAAGAVAKRRLAQRFPAPGRIVEVGRHRFHLDCQGEGTPTVVLEAGLGEPGITWAAVQPAIAGFTRVCSYDRAGLGWSGAGPSPRTRTAAVMVEELRALLAAGGVTGPLVLVGHSLGALVARLYAATYPNDVAGLVLVDPAHEDQEVRAPEAVQVTSRRMKRLAGPMFAVAGGLSALGVYALRPRMVPMPEADDIPDAVGPDRLRSVLARGSGTVRTLTRELRGVDESAAQMRATGRTRPGALEDMPLVVLSAGVEPPLPPIIPEAARRESEELRRTLHRELAALSRAGRLVVVDGAGHMIHHQRPEVVVAAVREVVAAVREA